MANYCATTRTNYFKVKDMAKFEEWVSTLPGVGSFTRNDLMALEANAGDCGGWPSIRYQESADEPPNEDEEFSIFDEIAHHLADGEVVIFMEVGNEKLRYLLGHAVAVHSDGRIISVNLEDAIYEAVKQQWGVVPTLCSY